jgi:hypothetical protein
VTRQADDTLSLFPVPNPRLLGLVSAAIAAVLLWETLAMSDRPMVAVVWGSLALSAYAASLMCLVATSQRAGLGLSSWKFGPWIMFWYGIVFGLLSVTWSHPQTGVATEIAVPSVLRALWLVGVGMSAMALGYQLGPSRLFRDLAARAVRRMAVRFTADVRSPMAPWVLYAVGIGASLLIAVTTGRFGFAGDISSGSTATGYGGILGALSSCAPLAVAAAALQVFRERLPRARITLAILFFAQLAFGAAAGVKENFVVTVLAMIIPFSAARRRTPKLAMAVLVLAFLIVIIPFNQAYRNYSREGYLTPRQDAVAAPGILAETVTSRSPASVIPQSIDYLAQRIREIDNPAIIVQRTPGQVSSLSPLQLVEEPIAGLVPRAIWPSKPIFVTGTQVTVDFYELAPGTSSTDTLIGGLYWHGGWIPVVVAMLLFGCGIRLLDDVLDVRANPHALFLVLLLFPSLVSGEQDWLSILSSIPATIFVWIVAIYITFGSQQRA